MVTRLEIRTEGALMSHSGTTEGRDLMREALGSPGLD